MGELRERMREKMMIRGYSESTIKTYLAQVRRFSKYFKRCPSKMGKEEIRDYQVYPAERSDLSVGYKCMFVSAVKYFYGNVLDRPELRSASGHPRGPRLYRWF